MNTKNNKCGNTCKSSSITSASCRKFGGLTDILRSPRVFEPQHALSNLKIIQFGYVGVKAAILNFLYQVSELYESINNNYDMQGVELAHLENCYDDSVNELLASISTALTQKLSDCSRMVSYDLHWVGNYNSTSGEWENDREEKDTVADGDTYNATKLKIEDMPIISYKNFDVAFPNSGVTTFFDRPSFQILGDRSNSSIVLRVATNNEWTPVGIDNYGRTGNELYSRRNSREKSKCTLFVLCPSKELRFKGDNTDVNAALVGGGIDASGNLTDDTFKAFATRRNAQLFFESILTPVLENPDLEEFDISQNDIVYFLSFLDKYVRQTELVSHSIETKINIKFSVEDNCC